MGFEFIPSSAHSGAILSSILQGYSSGAEMREKAHDARDQTRVGSLQAQHLNLIHIA